MEVIFSTIATKYRLHQCIALYHSLRRFLPEASLAVLSVDQESSRTLNTMSLPGLHAIDASELEDERLKAIKSERQLNEYCWTLKPVLLLYLLQKFPGYGIYAYLDADTYFFDNPLKLFRHGGNWSVLLTTHKVNRKANGGFAAFRRSSNLSALLEWWRDSCIEWCGCYNDSGRFGDQGYMDHFREKVKGVYYLDAPGANAAPWNSYNHDYTVKDKKIFVDKSPLIFYHFSGLRLKKFGSSVLITGDDFPCAVCAEYKVALRNAIREISEADASICEYFYEGV